MTQVNRATGAASSARPDPSGEIQKKPRPPRRQKKSVDRMQGGKRAKAPDATLARTRSATFQGTGATVLHGTQLLEQVQVKLDRAHFRKRIDSLGIFSKTEANQLSRLLAESWKDAMEEGARGWSEPAGKLTYRTDEANRLHEWMTRGLGSFVDNNDFIGTKKELAGRERAQTRFEDSYGAHFRDADGDPDFARMDEVMTRFLATNTDLRTSFSAEEQSFLESIFGVYARYIPSTPYSLGSERATPVEAGADWIVAAVQGHLARTLIDEVDALLAAQPVETIRSQLHREHGALSCLLPRGEAEWGLRDTIDGWSEREVREMAMRILHGRMKPGVAAEEIVEGFLADRAIQPERLGNLRRSVAAEQQRFVELFTKPMRDLLERFESGEVPETVRTEASSHSVVRSNKQLVAEWQHRVEQEPLLETYRQAQGELTNMRTDPAVTREAYQSRWDEVHSMGKTLGAKSDAHARAVVRDYPITLGDAITGRPDAQVFGTRTTPAMTVTNPLHTALTRLTNLEWSSGDEYRDLMRSLASDPLRVAALVYPSSIGTLPGQNFDEEIGRALWEVYDIAARQEAIETDARMVDSVVMPLARYYDELVVSREKSFEAYDAQKQEIDALLQRSLTS